MGSRLLELGDAALTLELGDGIDPALSARVMAARDRVVAAGFDGLTDIVPTYRSLTVHFDPLRVDRAALAACLVGAAETRLDDIAHGKHVEIPVRFGGDDGPDLEMVAATVGRSADEIVATLCDLTLRVYLIGFLPGFPYMGDLPEWLRLPRRTTPRTVVPANSVAIAGPQAAVYPWESPGGWHLLGRTPMRMFDAGNASRPALLAPGDTVRFVIA